MNNKLNSNETQIDGLMTQIDGLKIPYRSMYNVYGSIGYL